MIERLREQDCCGCAVCAKVCPKGCITMKEGTLGSLFPSVDISSCIDCGKCNAVCPISNNEKVKIVTSVSEAYAAYSLNAEERRCGSSGGIFGSFAKFLIKEGYVVYGSGFDSSLMLKCMRAENQDELKPLFKSKYLQSDISEGYYSIKKDLDGGGRVAVVSTPCQIAALKLFLGKDYENLVLIDFICHGVPSQVFFNKCKKYDEDKYGYNIKDFQFRAKIKRGATPHYYKLTVSKKGKNKTIIKPYFYSTHYAFFQQYISLRESCYDCVFAEKERVSDITISDFHEIERYISDVNRFDGVSKILTNTGKGRELFNMIKNDLWVKEFSLEDLIKDKVLFSEKTKRPVNRDEFVLDYETLDFKEFVKRQYNSNKYRIYLIYYKLPKLLRKAVKKILKID